MATRTISNAGGNYNSIATWVEGIIPTNADDVVATATSGNLVLVATHDCATFDLTGYLGTLSGAGTGGLRVYGGSVIFGGTITTTATLQLLTVAPTITSNGIAWTGSISFPGVITSTINGDLTVNGNIAISNGPINGSTIYFGGNLIVGGNQGGTPNALLYANGTDNQTWSGSFVLRQSVTINKPSGNFIVSGIVYYGAGTFSYINSDEVITTGSTLISGVAAVFDTSVIEWNNVYFNIGQTFLSDLIVNGLFQSSNPNTYNGANIIFNGNLNINQLTLGTTVFRYRGTGYWTGGGWIGNVMYIETDGALRIANGTYGSNTGSNGLYYVKGSIAKNSSLKINNIARLYGFGNKKVNLKTFTMLANAICYMDQMLSGSYEVKTDVISTSTSRLYFGQNQLQTTQRKAYFITVQNVICPQRALNVINRDANRGGNSGVIFGESGMCGFPLNQFPTETSFGMDNGMLNNMGN